MVLENKPPSDYDGSPRASEWNRRDEDSDTESYERYYAREKVNVHEHGRTLERKYHQMLRDEREKTRDERERARDEREKARDERERARDRREAILDASEALTREDGEQVDLDPSRGHVPLSLIHI